MLKFKIMTNCFNLNASNDWDWYEILLRINLILFYIANLKNRRKLLIILKFQNEENQYFLKKYASSLIISIFMNCKEYHTVLLDMYLLYSLWCIQTLNYFNLLITYFNHFSYRKIVVQKRTFWCYKDVMLKIFDFQIVLNFFWLSGVCSEINLSLKRQTFLKLIPYCKLCLHAVASEQLNCGRRKS